MKPWTGFWDVQVKKPSPLHYSLEQGQESFYTKGQKVSILGFVGHTISLTTPQVCCYTLKAAIYKILKKKKGMVVSQNLSSLPTPGLERTQIFKEAITIQRDKSSDRGSGE